MIIIVIVVLVVEVFKVKYGSIAVMVIIGAQFMYDFLVSYGDWIPIKRGRQINFDSGISGTLRGELTSYPGNIFTGKVSVERRLLSPETIKDQRVGGMNYLLDWITFGNVTINVTGEKWQWQDIPSTQADNKNGAIRFIGNIKGEPLWNKEEYPLYKELQNAYSINRSIVTAMEEIESQAANMAAKQYLDLDSATQLAKEVSDRMKNIRMIMRGKGGEGEALASEMGGQ